MSEPITWRDLPALASELRAMARSLLRREKQAASVQASDLVQSALLRLKPADRGWEQLTWENRLHFLRTINHVMRNVLTDHARARNAEKRKHLRAKSADDNEVQIDGLGKTHLDPFSRARSVWQDAQDNPELVIQFDEGLQRLEQLRPEWARYVSYYLFNGLDHKEIAAIEEVDESTVRKGLKAALIFINGEKSSS